MNKIFSLFICSLLSLTMQSQIHEVGVFLGGSNYIGDIGPTTYVAPNEPAFGLLYKWNKSPRHAYRFSYTQTKLTSSDHNSKEPSRNQRGYDFENNIKEVSLGLEFNFFDFNLHKLERKVTPYVYSGISYFRYDELYITGGSTRIDKAANGFAIPMTVGVKSNIWPNLILGIEVGTRFSLTDNIDGSNPKNSSLKPLRFGNINNNDWYVFSGITLTYTFGEKPCYCPE
ncbi:type IX secretion system protein PorG [Flavobacterium muglaense]|uniref:DUF6089 domain-containing protein n=1 Tax=Flavobacterium muglaense TaxID=2764716 RepID=A0A923MY71_9FLAO|nr:DUF6089 family protein [Flavobacterium muglaense]MBC5837168.1 hypothetical protein [Flavobacterium muglaense]MBC5843697.1 hypothetical protein [Flavobacterium muglaense]